MAYADIADLAADRDFLSRAAAAVAAEPGSPPDPMMWAIENQWELAATPGFGDAYGYAVLNGVARPGRDPAVISDGQILAAVTSLGFV